MKKRRWLPPLVAIVAIGALTPSYVRVFRVAGFSDAPSFLVGDRILVNETAYDVRLPYTNIVMISHSHPQRGDVVMFRPPAQDYLVFKRVIGCPGDTVLIRDSRLEINGVPLRYEQVDKRRFQLVAKPNNMGKLVEEESGNGRPHLITRTPDAFFTSSFGPIRVAPNQYYVVGDNRDNSLDSRQYGSVPRDSILGKVVHASRAGN